jgi:hypothetical protein
MKGVTMSQEKLEALLGKVDADKRAMLARIILGSAFVEPVVESFPIDGLTLSSPLAMSGNGGICDDDVF